MAAPARAASEQGDLRLPPDWLWRAVAADAGPAPLRPSRLRREGPDAEQRNGLVYGSALHLLLQHLPGLPPERRESAGRAFLAARHATIPATMHDPLLGEAIGVIAQPALAALFGPEARAEVAIIGRLARSGGTWREVRGTVDRLVVTESGIIVADFKTGTPEDRPPAAYVEQIALYRRVLAPLWPDLPLSMLLVWTRGPIVVTLDPAQLDRAAAGLLTAA